MGAEYPAFRETINVVTRSPEQVAFRAASPTKLVPTFVLT
jgi:hypothetical protein